MFKQSIVLVLARSSTMILAFLNSFFILHYVNENTRGYFFTFSSVAAFALIFELGIGAVIGQFLAHESANFDLQTSKFPSENRHTNRFFDILQTTLLWYSKIFAVGFLILFVLGFSIFSSKNVNYTFWALPWAITLAFTLLNILIELAFNAVYVTISINKPQVIKSTSLATAFLLSWSLILLDNKNSLLYLSFTPMFAFLFNLMAGIVFFPKVFRNILRKFESDFSWKNEVFELQKKIAISYASGAFIYNLFTPAMFFFQGSEAAARTGISLQFAGAIPNVVNYLISVQSLRIGSLFSSNLNIEAISAFKKILKAGFSILFLGILVMIGVYSLELSQKLVSMTELLFLYISYSINSIVYLMAIFILSQKKEYFGVFSLAIAIINAFVIPIATYFFSSFGQAIGFFAVNLFISLPWSFLIFYVEFKNCNRRVYVST